MVGWYTAQSSTQSTQQRPRDVRVSCRTGGFIAARIDGDLARRVSDLLVNTQFRPPARIAHSSRFHGGRRCRLGLVSWAGSKLAPCTRHLSLASPGAAPALAAERYQRC